MVGIVHPTRGEWIAVLLLEHEIAEASHPSERAEPLLQAVGISSCDQLAAALDPLGPTRLAVRMKHRRQLGKCRQQALVHLVEAACLFGAFSQSPPNEDSATLRSAVMITLLDALSRPGPRGLIDLGGPWDTDVLNALSAVLADSAELARVSDHLTRDQVWALLGWAEGACSWAVRCRSTNLILRVVQSFALLDGRLDRRDLLVVASLAQRAALRLRVNFDELAGSDLLAKGPPIPAWVMNAPAELPSTHEECGDGPSFEFRRKPAGFDPAALADLLKEGPQ